jgi:hypothetical protein
LAGLGGGLNTTKSSQLAALAVVVGVKVERWVEMQPLVGMGMKMEPILLCGNSYGELHCHRIEWQLKSIDVISIN